MVKIGLFCIRLLGSFTTFWSCLISGLPYHKDWRVSGRTYVIRPSFLACKLLGAPKGKLTIGNNFVCVSSIRHNGVGLIQPTVLSIPDGGEIIIGDKVGISGSTIRARERVTIGNGTVIGSGCLIIDTDGHPIDWRDRAKDDNSNIKSRPVTIGENVWVGARCIITKGVTIGDGSVIGAGSVVTKSIPPHSIAAGNPAVVIKKID